MNLLSVWTDGLQSNLLAEFCGLVGSIIATYLVVDKLIEQNRRRHYQPLKKTLRRAVGQNLAALTHLWAFSFGKAGTKDLTEGMTRDRSDVIRDLEARVEEDLRALESTADARQDFIKARSEFGVLEIARETCEDVTALGEVASRVSQVVLDDLELEGMLADLEANARALGHVHSFAEYLSKAIQTAEPPPSDLLIVLSLRCYRGAQAVWNYLESLEESQGIEGKR